MLLNHGAIALLLRDGVLYAEVSQALNGYNLIRINSETFY